MSVELLDGLVVQYENTTIESFFNEIRIGVIFWDDRVSTFFKIGVTIMY